MPGRTTPSFRFAMVTLAKLFDWRDALVIVKPETFIKWHRFGFRMFWSWKSRRLGRPPLPKNLRELIRKMDRENPTWGEERIVNELSLKLGIRVSSRTVGKHLDRDRPRGTTSSQRWSTFVRNHAKAIVACGFFASVTASFRVLYCIRRDGNRFETDPALQRNRAPNRRMDDSTVPRVPGVRPPLPIRNP
jgi:putative transposase